MIIEKTISNFCTSFYIPEIQKLVFRIPHVQILGTNHCGDSLQTVFNFRESFQNVLCCWDYAERLVASFSHQIKSEYYSVNRYVSIEIIALENFSALPNTWIKVSTKSCTRHAVFRSFLWDYIKPDSVTTTTHRKIWLHCWNKKSIGVSINYNMVKYWWLCGAIYIFLGTITYVSYVEILLSYNWSCYHCNCTWQIGGLWYQLHWQSDIYIH